MAVKSLFKDRKSSIQYGKIGEKLRRRHFNIVSTNYLSRITSIVSPFETDIPFTIKVDRGKDYVTLLQPLIGPTVQRANGDDVFTAQIFFWLNDGTDVSFAQLPLDFENETSPNSLDTRSVNYDRDAIFVNVNKPLSGIEPRNFLKLLQEELAPTYRRRMDLALKGALSSKG